MTERHKYLSSFDWMLYSPSKRSFRLFSVLGMVLNYSRIKKIIYANKFFCWQALKIDLILKIYFMFNDHIETLVLEQI